MAAWSIPMQQYRSLTAGTRPSALAAGQMFLNQADGVLCWPNAAGVVQTTSLTSETGTKITPTTPASGYMSSGYLGLAGRELLGVKGAASALTPMQSLLGFTRVAIWSGVNSTGVLNIQDGVGAIALGTVTARNVNVTSCYSRIRRIGYVSAVTAGALAGLYQTSVSWFLGTGGSYGFLAKFRFGCADAAAVAGARQFVGMTAATAAPTNVEPAALVNAIGIGHGAADSNLKLYCAGTATQTPIDLGANFPANTLSADLYDFTLWAARDGSINWQVDRYTGNSDTVAFSATGTFPNATPGTTAPSATNASTILGPRAWRSNNTTALAVALDVMIIAIHSDY